MSVFLDIHFRWEIVVVSCNGAVIGVFEKKSSAVFCVIEKVLVVKVLYI